MFLKIKILFFIFIIILLQSGKIYCYEDKQLYNRAVMAARKGNIDFAFMNYHRLLNDFPDSEYVANALFASGEYYFSIGDFTDADSMFTRLINDYSKYELKAFAFAYLIKISENQKKETAAEGLKKELIALKQVSLLFKDFEERIYLSPLNKNYKSIYYIDRVEFYIDEKLFIKIPF